MILNAVKPTNREIRNILFAPKKRRPFPIIIRKWRIIYLQVFDETGQNSDIITSQKAIYIPKENKNFNAFFAGNVNIETRNALKVKTEQLTYKKETEIAEAEEYIEFERENIAGNSVGAIVHVKDKRIELLKDVEINSFDFGNNNEFANKDIKSAKLTANYAMFDQSAGKIELKENVFIDVIPSGQNERFHSRPKSARITRLLFLPEKRSNKLI